VALLPSAFSGGAPSSQPSRQTARFALTLHGVKPELPRFARIDAEVASFMRRWGVPGLRVSLAIIFVWFGVLKPLGVSPAEDLVLATVRWLPVLRADQWLSVIGWWEVAIGLTFLHRSTIRVAIALLALQMVGAFMPLVMLPDVTFQAGRVPYAPTLEGQYIIKNLLIISAALVVGGTVRSAAATTASRVRRDG
jgi:uncharacterized membrane protein YkgB